MTEKPTTDEEALAALAARLFGSPETTDQADDPTEDADRKAARDLFNS